MRIWPLALVLCVACGNDPGGVSADESSSTDTGTGDESETDATGESDAAGDGDSAGDGDGDDTTDGPEGGTGMLDCADPMVTVAGSANFDGSDYQFTEVEWARLEVDGTPDAPCLRTLRLRVGDGSTRLYLTMARLDGGGYEIDWVEFQEEGSVLYSPVYSDLEGLVPTVSLGDMGDSCGYADFAFAAESVRFMEANSDNPNFYDLTGLDYTASGEWMVEWTGDVCP